MNGILPTAPYKVTRWNDNRPSNEWLTQSLNMKAPVVCAQCNNGWMSDLEHNHAKPAMKEMILSDQAIKLTQYRLNSLAYFAFKTAVIADHAHLTRNPFFTSTARRRFSKYLEVPKGVQMWIAALNSDGHGFFNGMYHRSPDKTLPEFEFYVLTFAIGFLIFQLVATRWLDYRHQFLSYPYVTQGDGWNTLSIPFWPCDGKDIAWPPPQRFDMKLLERFSHRWEDTDFSGLQNTPIP